MKSFAFVLLCLCALSLNGAFGEADKKETVDKREIGYVHKIKAGIVNNFGREKRDSKMWLVQPEHDLSRDMRGVIGHVEQINTATFNNREKRGFIGHVGSIRTNTFNNFRAKRGVIGHVDEINTGIFNNREKRGFIGHVGSINTDTFNNRERRHVGFIDY